MNKKNETEQTRQRLLKEFLDHQAKWADYQAQIAALSPEERATFDSLWEEDRRDAEFVDEIMHQVKNGAISQEEADRRLSRRSPRTLSALTFNGRPQILAYQAARSKDEPHLKLEHPHHRI